MRLFAAALAGSAGIRYSSFLFSDTLGALLWAGTFVLLGYALGAQAAWILRAYGDVVLVIGLALALLPPGLVAYRLWRRRRRGPATPRPSTSPLRRATSSRSLRGVC